MPSELSRRDAIRRLAAGGAAAATLPLWVENLLAVAELHAGHGSLRQAPAPDWTPTVLTPQQNDTVIALSEAIIPETDTPGAKGTGVNQYIDNVLGTASEENRRQFLDGLGWLDRRSEQQYQKSFAALDSAQQIAILTPLSDGSAPPDDRAGVEFFRAARGMTIAGYYTSAVGILQEIGEPETLAFLEFKGCTHPEHQ